MLNPQQTDRGPLESWMRDHEYAPPTTTDNERWPNVIQGEIISSDIQIGVGVVIEEGVVIKADKVRIGDFVYIGQRSKFIVPELHIGDYTRINADTFGGGTKPMQIGHNCYIGAKVRLDSRGGLKIGHNVGIGDASQIWTHIRHGDVVQGCRWDKEYALEIGDDVWLVARVTVGGAQQIGARAMVFNESNVTRSLMSDHTYGGSPLIDLTAKMGPQFEALSPDQKCKRLCKEIEIFEAEYPMFRGYVRATTYAHEFGDPEPLVSWFAAEDRVYTKNRHAAEVAFLKHTLAKFMPWEAE